MAIKPYTNYTWLYTKYVVENKSVEQIAKICGVGKSTIDRYVAKFALQKNRRKL